MYVFGPHHHHSRAAAGMSLSTAAAAPTAHETTETTAGTDRSDRTPVPPLTGLACASVQVANFSCYPGLCASDGTHTAGGHSGPEPQELKLGGKTLQQRAALALGWCEAHPPCSGFSLDPDNPFTLAYKSLNFTTAAVKNGDWTSWWRGERQPLPPVAPPPGIQNVFLNTSLIVEPCETTAPGSAEPVGRQKWISNADGSLTNAFIGGFATVYKCERQPPRVPPPGHGRPLYVSKDADDTCGGLNQRFSINDNGTITSVLDGSCFDRFHSGRVVQSHFCSHSGGQANDRWNYTGSGAIVSATGGCLSVGPAESPDSGGSPGRVCH
jgi:hypothetical protein